MNILVSCAGGPAAVGIIKSIEDFDSQGEHKTVAIDCDRLSVGFHLADRSYVVPFSVEDDYWKEVLKVIRKEKIDVIIPTGDADIVHFSKNKNVLNKMGVTVFMSDYETIKVCQNKLLFYKHLVKNGLEILLPKTSTDCREIDLPILCKPKRGSGSRGIELWETESQIKELDKVENLHYSSDYIFQEYLPGTEYTIDVLCDLEGKVLSVINLKGGSGYTTAPNVLAVHPIALERKQRDRILSNSSVLGTSHLTSSLSHVNGSYVIGVSSIVSSAISPIISKAGAVKLFSSKKSMGTFIKFFFLIIFLQ